MKEKKRSYLKVRISVALGLFLVLFAAIMARAVQLQVLESKPLKELASSQHSTTVEIESRRGEIYDRNSKELAVSMDVDSVYVQPARVTSARQALRVLKTELGVPERTARKAVSSKRSFVWLKRQVDLSEESRERLLALDGVGIIKESRRYYPNRRLAGNLLGFTGVDSVGLEGVELYYDDYLRGGSRKIVGQRDAIGRLIIFEDTDKTTLVKGLDVELTIDKTLQYITEKALEKAISSTGGIGGSAVVMNPWTGEVLAMANSPTFDPNEFKRFTPSDWRNRSVTDVFEPGSIFKAFLVAAAIEEGEVGPHDIFFCENGRYRVADRVFHDTKEHGWLSVAQIVKYSSNIGAAKIGEKLGREKLYRYLKSFGFGEKAGIDLPGESSGSLRHYRDWSEVTLQTVSFGQGVSTTGIQLVTAFSALANGGFVMKPYVVKALRDPSGKVVKETNPVIVRRVVSEETAARVTSILAGVTTQGGTGTNAAVRGFEVAGKTATAQKPDFENGGYRKGAFVAAFLGFVPARDPKLVILVTVDEPDEKSYHGGVAAAPAFKEIATQGLSYMGVFPEAPVDGVGERPLLRLADARGGELEALVRRRSPGGGALQDGVVPDFRGRTMRTVMRMAVEQEVKVEFKGSGRAARQSPRPGSPAPDGPVVVWFE